MLTDHQELLNLAAAPPTRELAAEPDNNVFEDGCSTPPPASPRPTPPGIILTVEGSASPEIIDVASSSRQHRATTRSSRRSRQQHPSATQHRSPSGSRMSATRQASHPQQQQNGHRLRDPAHLSGSGVSRSQSMRTARRPQSVDPAHRFRHRIASIPNDMTLPSSDGGQRLASNQSLPLPDDEDFMRLRNFAITSKGIVNRGDSFRSKSRSAHSVASMGVVQQQMPLTPSHQLKDDSNVDYASSSSAQQEEATTVTEAAITEGASAAPEVSKGSKYRVLVLGPPDVGKSALINQFMTSEYMCAYESSQDEENEKSVPVILNGTESELFFSEHQFSGDSNTNFCELFNADAYLVVYSVTSKRSLHSAKEALKLIHKWDDVHCKAMILVGNKTDLARHRVLSTDDGRSLAIEEGSKFIETSAGINHQVDELLVGILSQIRLKQSSRDKALQKRESVSLGSSSKQLRGGKCSGCAGCKAKGILKRILKKACSRSKSCDNLHVL